MNLRLLALSFAILSAPVFARDIVVNVEFPKGEKFEQSIPDDTKTWPLPPGPYQVRIKPNSESCVEAIRELRYPIEYSAAQLPELAAPVPKGQLGYTPQSPLTFETTNIGWTITMKAKEGPDFITVVGEALHAKGEILQAVHGEGSGKLKQKIQQPNGGIKVREITPNVAQSIVAVMTKTRFQLYATPGKAYKVPLRRGAKAIEVTVTCDYAK